ncbi:MAG: glycosyltransferase [Candidatus Berkelbacteria bacterium]|nr:glycosyltransferase [Candidatus Berkelbacteria bacterium]
MTKIVIIPTINELPHLKILVPKLLALGFDILIIDDNSTDGTADFLLESKEKYRGKFDYQIRPKKLGLQSAYFFGFEKSMKKYDLILMMDGDGAHDPCVIPKMLGKISKGADLVIGSRYAKGGKVENFPISRRIISRVGNFLCRKIISKKIFDWTGGFYLWKSSLLEKIINRKYINGFGFQIQMKKYAIKSGAKISEVPINFKNCQNEKSKFRFLMIFEAAKILFFE